jgi:uncharacterized integral membrane protein
MLGFARWIIGFFIAILFAGFAAMNRQSVTLHISPVHDPLEWPLFVIILGFAALGFLIGAFTVWLNDGKLRREKRQQKRQIKTLEAELKKAETPSIRIQTDDTEGLGTIPVITHQP